MGLETGPSSPRIELNFPQPRSITEATGEFCVRDATGRTLGHFFWWDGATTLARDDVPHGG
jgi:hypothetical protein